MWRLAALGALLAVAACATPPPATLPGDALSGRLSLQVDAHGGRAAQSIAAGFELRGNAERGELRLSTPLGTTLVAASWSPEQARLVTPQGETLYADLEALSLAAFGETLPLRALPDWLQGRPWAGAPGAAQPLQPGPGFIQLGWTVDLARLGTGQVLALRADPPGVRLRAQMDVAP